MQIGQQNSVQQHYQEVLRFELYLLMKHNTSGLIHDTLSTFSS